MSDDDNQSSQANEATDELIAPPRSFAAFLTNLENGEFHAELSTELQELAAYLQAHANNYHHPYDLVQTLEEEINMMKAMITLSNICAEEEAKLDQDLQEDFAHE